MPTALEHWSVPINHMVSFFPEAQKSRTCHSPAACSRGKHTCAVSPTVCLESCSLGMNPEKVLLVLNPATFPWSMAHVFPREATPGIFGLHLLWSLFISFCHFEDLGSLFCIKWLSNFSQGYKMILSSSSQSSSFRLNLQWFEKWWKYCIKLIL